MKRHFLVTMMLAVGMASTQSHSGELGIGAAFASLGAPQKEVEANNYIVPYFQYRTDNWDIDLLSIGYHVYQGQQLQVKAIGQFRFDGFEVDGNTKLAGLNDRYNAFDIGMSVKVPNRYCTIELKYLIDATNTYNGQEFGIDVEKVFMFSHSYFVPSVGVSWQSKKLVDYYYGVSSSEATYDMPQYEGDTALNVNIQGMYGYMIDDHSNFILGVQGIVYGDNIYDSPIVDSSLNLNVFVAYLYKL